MSDKRKAKKRKEEGSGAEEEKPSKEEYAVAKWLRAHLPAKRTKFLNHHVEYFTGSKAVDALLESRWGTAPAALFTSRADCATYLHTMLLHKFFHRAKKVAVSEAELRGARGARRNNTDKRGSGDDTDNKEARTNKTKEASTGGTRKRKVRLEMHADQAFVDSLDAYVWIYEPIPLTYWLAGLALLLAAIAVCMFPLWPPTVRKGVYYVSVLAAGFLVLVLALAALRLVVFCAVWVLTLSRHHVWLLPNLTEDVGFFASFWPLYQYEYHGAGAPSDADRAKGKKRRKKDKYSDDEAEPVLAPEAAPLDEPAPTPAHEPELRAGAEEAGGSSAESEDSRRSSTPRDYDMLEDTADLRR